jgi:hypothetical protein
MPRCQGGEGKESGERCCVWGVFWRCRGDTTSHEGIPITTVPRTLLDLAATIQPHRLERALARAERLQLYDHRAITDLEAGLPEPMVVRFTWHEPRATIQRRLQALLHH